MELKPSAGSNMRQEEIRHHMTHRQHQYLHSRKCQRVSKPHLQPSPIKHNVESTPRNSRKIPNLRTSPTHPVVKKNYLNPSLFSINLYADTRPGRLRVLTLPRDPKALTEPAALFPLSQISALERVSPARFLAEQCTP